MATELVNMGTGMLKFTCMHSYEYKEKRFLNCQSIGLTHSHFFHGERELWSEHWPDPIWPILISFAEHESCYWDGYEEELWDQGGGTQQQDEMMSSGEDEEDRGSDEEREEEGVEGVDFGGLNMDESVKIAVKKRSAKKFPAFEYSDRLTGDFKLLMGEANLAVAKGNSKTAINICLEIIRNIPDSPAPYETLAVIYEEQSDLYKSLQYGLISAHLWPKDPQKWYSLAMKSQELKDDENYKLCISKALRFSHLTNDRGFIEEIMGHFSRANDAQMSEEMTGKIASGYRKLIKIAEEGEGPEMNEMVEKFEISCEPGGRNEIQWALTYISLISKFPEVTSEEKILKCLRWLLLPSRKPALTYLIVVCTSLHVAHNYLYNSSLLLPSPPRDHVSDSNLPPPPGWRVPSSPLRHPRQGDPNPWRPHLPQLGWWERVWIMWSCLVLMRCLLGPAVGWIVRICLWNTDASVRTRGVRVVPGHLTESIDTFSPEFQQQIIIALCVHNAVFPCQRIPQPISYIYKR
eukprot:sb/3463871/